MVFGALKFIHVVSVIVWVGGIITMTLLNMRLARVREAGAQAALAQFGGFVGRAVFLPAAGLTFLAGLATGLSAGFQLNSLWIIWGFAVIVLSMLLTNGVMRPLGARIGALASSGQQAQVPALQSRLLWLSVLNIVLLLSAVWVMIAKPALG